MKHDIVSTSRRDFLKNSMLGGAAAIAVTQVPAAVSAQTALPVPTAAPAATPRPAAPVQPPVRLKTAGITVNACHPGDVNSKLSNAFGFGGSESPGEGAATPLYLALSAEPGEITGKYFEHMKQVSCPFIKERMAVDTLFEYCRNLGNL